MFERNQEVIETKDFAPMPKAFSTAAMLGICAAGVTGLGVTFAYLTDSDATVNQLSVSNIEIEVVEEFEPPKQPEVGDSFVKRVSVSNTGEGEAFARVMVVFSDDFAQTCTNIDFNTNDWTELKQDGYHYLRKPLQPGEQSPELFNKVDISDKPVQGWKEYDIFVYGEAAQAKDPQTGAMYESAETAFASLGGGSQ